MKKKFKETKFAKWVKRHSEEILSIGIGVGTGVAIGTAAVKMAQREFNRGWWSGREIGKSETIDLIVATDEGKEIVLNATDDNGSKCYSEQDIDNKVRLAGMFKEYAKNHNLGSTIRIDRADILRVPRAKKIHTDEI